MHRIISIEKLKQICNEYHKRISNLEATKIDIEYEVAKKDHEVRDDNRYLENEKKISRCRVYS